jgi:hypothetical protein
MLQNWGLGPFGNQGINPLSQAINPQSATPLVPQAIQLLQIVPQQLQQLQQQEYARLQQLQQIQQLVQFVAYQLQYLSQHQSQPGSLGILGGQGLGQPLQTLGGGIPSAFSSLPLHVM